jgi:hypothetical protein
MKKLIALLIIAAVIFSLWLWANTGRKTEFLDALRESSSESHEVFLERYYNGEVLQTARITGQQFRARLEKFGSGFGRLRHTFTKCWVPHHRIKFDKEGKDAKIEICFTCNEIWTEATGRRKIPEDWRQPLRDLFLAQGIPDTAPTSNDFLQHMNAQIEEAEPQR